MTKQLRRLLVGALALVAVTACDEGTDPVATATVQVRAYVDANNDNAFNAADDDAIQGATVTLTLVGGDGRTIEETTAADGLATFDAVEIGSYTASITLPAAMTDVELASASAPSVTVSEDVTAEASFRYVYVPGSVEGHAFIGDTYSATAPAVPGLGVTVTQGTESWTATTDASGAFSVVGLLPGAYDVTVDVPAYLSTGTATQSVTVTADAAATADFGFATNATHTVPEVRAAAEGTVVTVLAVATTATAGDLAALSGSTFFVQEGGEGIMVYQGAADVEGAVELGDMVLVHGERSVFGGEMQIGADVVIPVGEGTLPDATPLTVTELNTDTYQGLLASLDNMYVDGVDGGEIFVTELSTGVSTVVYADSDSGIDPATDVTVGAIYDFTGVVSVYQGTPQLEVRMPADIVEETGVAMTMADVRAATNGTAVEVTGVVTEAGTLEGNGFYMEDATAGVFVYTGFGNVPAGLAVGDVVTVSGERAQYFDVVQIGGTVVVTETGETVTPAPTAITAAELNSGDFQGRLVVMNDVVVDSINGSNVFVSETAGGEAALIRIDSDSGVAVSGFVVGNTFTIAGVVSNFGGTEQIKPRSEADVEGTVVVEPVTTIAEARAGADGDPVELTGVVTVTNGPDGMLDYRNAYLQDATGGILIRMPTDTVVTLGDSVTVVGSRGSFNAELQVNVDADGLTRHGTGTIPAPLAITPAQLEAGEHQGELAVLTAVEVTAVDGSNVTVTDGTNTTLVYIDSTTGIDAAATFTVGSSYDVVGVVSRYNDTMELKPRQQSDITAN